MGEIIVQKLNPQELQKRIETLSVRLEENIRETLVEKLAEQEMHIENLYTHLSELHSLKELKQVIVDNALLGSPSFLQKKIEIRPAHKLMEHQGFYGLEGEQNAHYRWTKHNFYFDLPIDRSEEREVILQFRSDDDIANNIFCYADGIQIDMELDKENDSLVFHGMLPSEQLITNTRVAFLVGSDYLPSEKNAEVLDTRRVSIIFEKLNIK